MELEGAHDIPSERARVWAALNDPEVLRVCIPGCKELTQTSDTRFSARVVSSIGPVSASFKGNVELTDIEPETGYTIAGTGQGGVAGFAKGSARVHLADAEEGRATHLTYKVKAEIGGKLASVGARMLEGAARKTADQFFSSLVAQLGGTGGPHEVDPAAQDARPVSAATPAQHAPSPRNAESRTLRVEVGEIRIVHQSPPWLGAAAAAGWLVALLALRHRSSR